MTPYVNHLSTVYLTIVHKTYTCVCTAKHQKPMNLFPSHQQDTHALLIFLLLIFLLLIFLLLIFLPTAHLPTALLIFLLHIFLKQKPSMGSMWRSSSSRRLLLRTLRTNMRCQNRPISVFRIARYSTKENMLKTALIASKGLLYHVQKMGDDCTVWSENFAQRSGKVGK